jgi:hypothetical protein|nr:MAG TPA: hypothetical protein [Caudoviricetes sp.]
MATREGIYVGGHEIVERYVGSRLVWEKWVFVKQIDISEEVSISGGSGLTVSLETERNGQRNTGRWGNGKLIIAGRTILVKSATAEIYTNSWNNRSYYKITLEFYNSTDKDQFLSSRNYRGLQFYSKEKKR